MQTFNDTSCPKYTYHGQPFITFSTKSGKITINGVARKMLDLHVGSQVEFYCKDIDGKHEWYIAKVHEGGFKLLKHRGSHMLVFSRKDLVLAIFNSLLFEGDIARAYILRKRRVEDKWVYKLDTSQIKNK